MQCCVVGIKEIAKDPHMNMSAKYWCDKKSKEQKDDYQFKEVFDNQVNMLDNINTKTQER